MKILLTVFGVYNTLENVDDEVFKEIIDKIKQVKEINNDDVILISFCDNTENKDIFMYYLRNITNDNEILIGRQFLNNVYYNDIVKSGALLYNDFLTYSVNQSEYIINKCSLSYVNDVVINEDDKTATIYVTLIPSKIWDVYTKVNKNENRLSV